MKERRLPSESIRWTASVDGKSPLLSPVLHQEPVLAPGNEKLYEEMRTRLDVLSQTDASVTLPLTDRAMRHLSALGVKTHGSYPFAHSVFIPIEGRSIQVHVNEVMDEKTPNNPRYGLVSLIDTTQNVPQIVARYFANSQVLPEIKKLMTEGGLGYELVHYTSGQRTHMALDREGVFFVVNDIATAPGAQGQGTLEVAIFVPGKESAQLIGRLIAEHLLPGHHVGLGGAAGPVTGALQVNMNNPGFRLPPPPKDLSIKANYDELVKLLIRRQVWDR